MASTDHHERTKSWLDQDEKTWDSKIEIATGIVLYKNVLPRDLNIVKRLESIVDNTTARFQWSEATVGYQERMPDYRDCQDFKYKFHEDDFDKSKKNIEMAELYNDVTYRQLQAVKDYARDHHVAELRFWEATNFVKYGPGQHFAEHSDHGFSYNCVVSLVAYPNDDYVGGEIEFRNQSVFLKPEAGDVVIFPSTFIYSHRALPVDSGVKYSMVTMLDYSDKFHRPDFFQETGS
jgi:hypothetical protein